MYNKPHSTIPELVLNSL